MNELSILVKVNILLFIFMLIVVLCAVVISFIRNNKKREYGNLIIEVKDNSVKVDIFISVIYFIMGALQLIIVLKGHIFLFENNAVIFLMAAFVFSIRGFSRVQIRELGIISRDSFWMWNDVEKYNFIISSKILEFKLKNRVFKRRKILLNECDIAKVEEILSNIDNRS